MANNMHFQAQFGQLIDDLLKNGVKSIDNTQYYITYDQRRDAQKKCLTVYASIYVNVYGNLHVQASFVGMQRGIWLPDPPPFFWWTFFFCLASNLYG